MKKIAIFGSTGSIGVSTLSVIGKLRNKFEVVALTANQNIEILIKQVEEFNPKIVVIGTENFENMLREKIGHKCEIICCKEGLTKLARDLDYDIFVGAMVGFSGLAPTIEAIKRGKRIALANKETLVVAGEIITNMIKQYQSEIIPVDSEHSAIFQCLVGEKIETVEKLLLTASGGPFLNKTKLELLNVSVEEALNHPNWKMGNKITIDSATMMNKGLEVIEAHWLFNLPKNKIEVVVHPQSIIHSMVEFVDGSTKAQLSIPDMKLPIQYALTFPERIPTDFVRTDLPKLSSLNFLEPDFEKFECLKLAYDVLNDGGLAPCILNAANEVAVSKFLNGEIKFYKIPEIIKKSLDNISNNSDLDLEKIIECDRLTREFAAKLN